MEIGNTIGLGGMAPVVAVAVPPPVSAAGRGAVAPAPTAGQGGAPSALGAGQSVAPSASTLGGGASAANAPAMMAGALAGPQAGMSPEAKRVAEEKAIAKVMQDKFNQACETCKNRKYQDGSNDPGVSFKSPTSIDPGLAASAVLGHEMEHVSHEQARAKQEGREVVSQTVRLHNAICPECGRVYVAGGVTETTTRGATKPQNPAQQGGAAGGLDISA